MRYMSLWRPGKNATPPTEKLMAQMGQLIEDMTKSGKLVATGGWNPAGPCTLVTSSGGGVRVTDGPFAEAKEVIAGYCIFNAESKEEAIELTRKFLEIAGEGTCELRELGGPGQGC